MLRAVSTQGNHINGTPIFHFADICFIAQC
jgi:hypothetical protein